MSRGARRRVFAAVWLGAAALAALIWVAAEASIRHLGAQARHGALVSATLRAGTAAADLQRTLASTAGLNVLAQARAALLERGETAGAATLQRQLAALARRPAFGIADMAITDRHGLVIWSGSGAAGQISLADASYFAPLRDGATKLAIGTPGDEHRLGSRDGIPVARALTDSNGRFAGVSVVSLDIAALSRQITQPDTRRDGLAMLLRLTPATPAVLAYGRPRDRSREAPPEDVLHHLLMLAASRQDGGAVLVEAASQQRFLAGWSRLEPAGLVVAIVAKADIALADARREASIIRAVAAALSLLVIMGAIGLLLLRARHRAAEALRAARRAQTATEAARTELERLVASLPAMVYHGDLTADGTLISRYISTNAAQVIGWPHDRLPPRDTFLAHVDPGRGREVTEFFIGLLKGGPDTLEYRMARPDGSWIWLRHHARVVARNRAGGEVIGSLADITEERALRAQAAISSQLASLGEMAGGIAHELNRPLAVMVMAAHNALATLEESAPDLDQVHSRLKRIAAQGVRANRIIHHLQALSRPENEPQEEICLPRAIEGALTLAGGALRQAHVVLEDRVPTPLPPVLGQAIAIEQVLVNLFTNARDALTACPPDARRLSLGATYDQGHVTLEVADTGPGIPEAALSRIFEPFFTTKATGHGTGLGLSICHAAMREMGGAVTAHNTAHGAAFRLMFRRAPQAGCPSPDASE